MFENEEIEKLKQEIQDLSLRVEKIEKGCLVQEVSDDDLYEEAKVAVTELGKASASYLQRKLNIGYARAARLLDMLEDRGIIGPGKGAKPRKVI